MDDKQKYDEIEFDDSSIEDQNDFPDEDLSADRKIFTDKGDPEIESLMKRYQKGTLEIQPDYQRMFVWDSKKASRLIESSLLDIPLPIIYLAEDAGSKVVNIIDGQQRLTSFFSFISGKFPDGKTFKLTGLKVFKECNGKTFKDLTEELQDKIISYPIRTITFKKESDANLKYEIFERLNTGAAPLNDQELRNCVYRGTYNKLLRELANNEDFRFITGIVNPDKRMRDIELVLRFASFFHTNYLDYKAPTKKFLNKEMEKYQNISPADAAELTNAFKNAVSIIRSIFSEHSFKRYYAGDSRHQSGRWETKKFNTSLYDVLMWTMAREDKNKVFQNLDSVREAFIHLMTENNEFIEAIEKSTSSIYAVKIRFDLWRKELEQIVEYGSKEVRCFTYELKEKLFNNCPICEICKNKIREIDDAALDHIKQYWRGGKTIPENARLTHRYCNMARSRKD